MRVLALLLCLGLPAEDAVVEVVKSHEHSSDVVHCAHCDGGFEHVVGALAAGLVNGAGALLGDRVPYGSDDLLVVHFVEDAVALRVKRYRAYRPAG